MITRSGWRALPSERFCSDRGRTSGHCTSKGRWGSRLGFVGDGPVPASDYIHPEFGFFCPTPRFRRRLRVALACLVVAGVGAALMATADRPKLAAPVTGAMSTGSPGSRIGNWPRLGSIHHDTFSVGLNKTAGSGCASTCCFPCCHSPTVARGKPRESKKR
jgi:hypothetical protein